MRIVQSSTAVGPFHILVVDDDELAVLNVQRALSHDGQVATFTSAGDGVEALELLRSGRLSGDRLLVLTDVNMPRMSGIELLREIRNDPELRNLTVVVLTASTKDADRADAFSLHTAGYFIKSRSAPHLRDMVVWLRAYWTGSGFSPPRALNGA